MWNINCLPQNKYANTFCKLAMQAFIAFYGNFGKESKSWTHSENAGYNMMEEISTRYLHGVSIGA